MKKTFCRLLNGSVVAAFLLLLLPGCTKSPGVKMYTYTIRRPIYALKSSVLANINGSAYQSFDSVGKFYIAGKTIFLSEVDKGIHIIDNSDPTHPVQTAFLNIPGNEDIAVKGNTLYADMYSDLLAIDISNPRHVQITDMVINLFPAAGYGYGIDSNLVITGYITKDTTVLLRNGPGTCFNCPNIYPGGVAMADAAYAAASSSTGVGDPWQKWR